MSPEAESLALIAEAGLASALKSCWASIVDVPAPDSWCTHAFTPSIPSPVATWFDQAQMFRTCNQTLQGQARKSL